MPVRFPYALARPNRRWGSMWALFAGLAACREEPPPPLPLLDAPTSSDGNVQLSVRGVVMTASPSPADYRKGMTSMNRAAELAKAPKVESWEVDWLEQATRHGEPGTVILASKGLARHAPKRALELFDEQGLDRFDEALIETGPAGIDHLLDRPQKVGEPPILALSMLVERHGETPQAKAAVPTLLRWLAGANATAEVLVVKALSQVEGGKPMILEHAGANDRALRHGAVRAIGKFAPRSDEAKQTLERATKDGDPEIAAEAKRALAAPPP